MNEVIIDEAIVNLSRGLCICGKTDGDQYLFCDLMRGKVNPEYCKHCGYVFPTGEDFEQ